MHPDRAARKGGAIPSPGGQERACGLGPSARPGWRNSPRKQPEHSGHRAGDPAPLPEPEHPQADVGQDRPHQQHHQDPRSPSHQRAHHATLRPNGRAPCTAPPPIGLPGKRERTPDLCHSRSQFGRKPAVACLNNRLDGLVDFLARQRAVRMTEDHAEMNALLVVREISPPEGVEIHGGFQSRTRRIGPPLRKARPTARCSRQFKREIAAHRGKRRQRPLLGHLFARFNRTSKSSSAAAHRSRSSNGASSA